MRTEVLEDLPMHSLLAGVTSRFEIWEHLLRITRARIVLEVGVWKGSFARQILERCEFIERYYMIDPWANLPDWNKPFNVSNEAFEEVYAEAMRQTEFASSKRVVLRGRTKEKIDAVPDNSLDFAYIDGDHTLRGITVDLIKLLPKVRDGGLIGGDDFVNTPWQHSSSYEPTMVCPFSIYFSEAMDLPIVALPFDQFVLQKRKNASFVFIDLTGCFKDVSLGKRPTGVKKLVRKMLSKIRL